jgi:hypothetical protein
MRLARLCGSGFVARAGGSQSRHFRWCFKSYLPASVVFMSVMHPKIIWLDWTTKKVAQLVRPTMCRKTKQADKERTKRNWACAGAPHLSCHIPQDITWVDRILLEGLIGQRACYNRGRLVICGASFAIAFYFRNIVPCHLSTMPDLPSYDPGPSTRKGSWKRHSYLSFRMVMCLYD